jgi:FG-GAP-like repeat
MRLGYVSRPPRVVTIAFAAAVAVLVASTIFRLHVSSTPKVDDASLSPIGHFPDFAPVVPETEFVDIDGDGLGDLIDTLGANTVRTAYRSHGWNTPQSIMAGYDTRVVVAASGDASHTRFADLDGDGRADLLVMSGPDNDITAYRNLGWTTPRMFVPRYRLQLGRAFGPISAVRFADLDGDRRADLVAASVTDHTVVAYRNQGWSAPALFTAADHRVLATGYDTLATVDVAEMDGDGRADLLTQSGPTDAVTAHRNHGWTAAQIFDDHDTKPVTAGLGPLWQLKFGDLDHDHRADLVAAVGQTWPGYRNQGWAAPTLIPTRDPQEVAGGFAL